MALGCYHRVQRGPVIRCPANGGGIDVAQQPRLVGGIDVLERIVGTYEIDFALNRDPVPTRSEHDCRARSCPKIHKFSRSTSCYEADH